jgi:hypothetical protein
MKEIPVTGTKLLSKEKNTVSERNLLPQKKEIAFTGRIFLS